MQYSFQRYLTAKKSVDDRALNQYVWQAFTQRLAELEGLPEIQILELGGGIGTMFQRLVEGSALSRALYVLVDEQAENLGHARKILAEWAARQGLDYRLAGEMLEFRGGGSRLDLALVKDDIHRYLRGCETARFDLVVASAVLDLLDVPPILVEMKRVTRRGGLFYLTINFDGMTALEPPVNAIFDERIIDLYHRSMDERIIDGRPSGTSRTGRRLFSWLSQAGLRILAAGSSDWAVYARDGKYPGDEAYFLHFILHFFEQSLSGSLELDPAQFSDWLAERRRQIERGELVFIAHQLDFLVEAP
jgi:SAM-dependent methyltransferase